VNVDFPTIRQLLANVIFWILEYQYLKKTQQKLSVLSVNMVHSHQQSFIPKYHCQVLGMCDGAHQYPAI